MNFNIMAPFVRFPHIGDQKSSVTERHADKQLCPFPGFRLAILKIETPGRNFTKNEICGQHRDYKR